MWRDTPRIVVLCVIGFIIGSYFSNVRASTCTYSASLGSTHVNSKQQFNEFNPGLGVECDKYQVGMYYNSIRRATVYAGRVVAFNQYTGIKYGVIGSI